MNTIRSWDPKAKRFVFVDLRLQEDWQEQIRRWAGGRPLTVFRVRWGDRVLELGAEDLIGLIEKRGEGL